MNRKPAPPNRHRKKQSLFHWREQLLSRRRFLLAAAGGGLACLFPLASMADKQAMQQDPWPVIDAVQQQLFPGEPGIPGAREINALGYLQFVVNDKTLPQEDRDFILQGTTWLQGMSTKKYRRGFTQLNNNEREQLLRLIAGSEAGENWLSTLLLYIFEALLSDPVYGGNTGEAGWQWLAHTPGFPRPPADKTFVQLLKI